MYRLFLVTAICCQAGVYFVALSAQLSEFGLVINVVNILTAKSCVLFYRTKYTHTFLSSKKSMTKVPCRLFVLDKTTRQTPQQPAELATKLAFGQLLLLQTVLGSFVVVLT
jgi:hypothetical protein